MAARSAELQDGETANVSAYPVPQETAAASQLETLPAHAHSALCEACACHERPLHQPGIR